MAEESSQYHFDPATYLEMVTRDIPDYVELQERTARATLGVAARTILELGIGTGETAVRVLAAHPDAELVGVDESPHMLDHARQRLPKAELLVRRLEEPLPAGSYDLVVSAFSVHHLDGPEKAELFGRIAAALRPGGRFVLTDVIVPDDPSDVVLEIDGVHDRPSRIDKQLAWLEEAGLRTQVIWTARDLAILVADRG